MCGACRVWCLKAVCCFVGFSKLSLLEAVAFVHVWIRVFFAEFSPSIHKSFLFCSKVLAFLEHFQRVEVTICHYSLSTQVFVRRALSTTVLALGSKLAVQRLNFHFYRPKVVSFSFLLFPFFPWTSRHFLFPFTLHCLFLSFPSDLYTMLLLMSLFLQTI